MNKSFYRQALAFIFTFDLSSRESFEGLPKFLDFVEQTTSDNLVKILVGCKSDLKREVSREDAENFS